MDLGTYRLVCSNGAIAFDGFEQNKIKHSAMCCIYCGKSYKTRMNLDKHVILCEITNKSKRNHTSTDDDNDELKEQTISSKKLYYYR